MGAHLKFRGGKSLVAVAAALTALSIVAAPAYAAPDCTKNPPKVQPLAGGQGTLESTIVGRSGQLFFTTSNGGGSLMRMKTRQSKPRTVVSGVEAPGGLAHLPGRKLLLGYGDSLQGGSTGNVDPEAGLLKVDPKRNSSKLYASKLSMANGVARGPDGTVYASNDLGLGIDRVSPAGTVELSWAPILSANGLAVGRKNKYIYAAQTFQPAAIQRISIANPTQSTPFFQAGVADIAAGFDGLARDRHGTIYVAANEAGEIWRIGRDHQACVLARGLANPSAVAIGHGNRGFTHGNIYAVGFGGEVVELKGATKSRP